MADATRLGEGMYCVGLPPGTRQELNSWKRNGYGDPSPPIGRRRYFFKLYALDTALGDLHGPDAEALYRRHGGPYPGPDRAGRHIPQVRLNKSPSGPTVPGKTLQAGPTHPFLER